MLKWKLLTKLFHLQDVKFATYYSTPHFSTT